MRGTRESERVEVPAKMGKKLVRSCAQITAWWFENVPALRATWSQSCGLREEGSFPPTPSAIAIDEFESPPLAVACNDFV